jgi:outer membrane receptor protein involved in Fe transport
MIVTATRQQERLLDYAGSISRIDASEVQVTGSTHHSEILNKSPGTLIQRGSGEESLTAIRSPVLSGPGSCGAFLFLEDGIPIRPTGFCNVNDLFEVNTEQAEAIEVVRGLGSALYGSSAVHGIVNVIMPDPADLPVWAVSGESGSDEYVRGRLALSNVGDLTDLGWVGLYTRDGGFRVDSGFKEGKLNGLLVHRLANGLLRVRAAGTVLNQETAGFILGEDAYKDPDLAHANLNPEAFRDAHSARLTTQWQAPMSDTGEFNLRGIVRTSRMDFLQHFLIGKPLETNGQDSAAMLASYDWTPSEQLHFTGGIDLEFAQSFLVEDQAGPATDGPTPAANGIRPAGKHYDYSVDAWNLAAYGQVERSLGARWRLTAGLRAERNDYEYDNRMLTGNTDENGVPCGFGGCLYTRPADRSDTFTNLAPKLALTFAFLPEHRAYLSAGRGFRAPETTELYRLQRQQTVADLSSERIDSVELGVRGELPRLSYSLALFDMDKEHVIFRDSNAFNVSDGKTSHRGVEYELGTQIFDRLRLSAAGTYARHEYDFSRAIEQGETISRGDDVDTAPRHLHTARLDWTPRDNIRSQLEFVHVGRYFVDAANAHTYPGHDLVNLRTLWRVTPQWHVTARVNNVFDEPYADRADFAFGNFRYFPGRDRTYFLEIGFAARRDD